jgi:hypothetical protein
MHCVEQREYYALAKLERSRKETAGDLVLLPILKEHYYADVQDNTRIYIPKIDSQYDAR